MAYKLLFFILLSSLVTHAQNVTTSETTVTSGPVLSAPAATASEFTPSNKLSGDFRYRHQELKDNLNEKRRQHRISLRIGHVFNIQPDLKFTYRLMTGSSANSGNTTLGEKDKTQGSPRYSIGLDQAFATYAADTDLNLFIGKMPQFFQSAGKNQTILDRDITPEGLGVQYKQSFMDKTLEATLNGASFWVRERYDTLGEDEADSFLNIAQGVLNYKISSVLSITGGLGIFSFTELQDNKPGDIVTPTATDAKGNTTVNGNYVYQYEMDQKFIEVKWNHKPFEFSVFTEQITNDGADSENEAKIYGVGLAYDKFSFAYIKQEIETDAVLGLYTSSDFAAGETNSRGKIIQLGYKLNKNAAFNYSLYDAERNVLTFPTEYKISQLDLTIFF